MNPDRMIVIRDVTKEECWWLQETVPTGTVVYRFWGTTYGVIGNGTPVTYNADGEYPFFELPYDSVVPDD